MTTYAIERNGSLVNQVVFIGDSAKNLYREHDIVPITLATIKEATELADILCGTVVDYYEYNTNKLSNAA